MGKCSALGCSRHGGQGFRVFCFPKDPQRRQDWAAQVQRESWFPNDNSRLCQVQVHFSPDQFIQRVGAEAKKILRFDAVPTIFGPRSRVARAPPSRIRSGPSTLKLPVGQQILGEHAYATSDPIPDFRAGPAVELGEDRLWASPTALAMDASPGDPIFDVEVATAEPDQVDLMLRLRASQREVKQLQGLLRREKAKSNRMASELTQNQFASEVGRRRRGGKGSSNPALKKTLPVQCSGYQTLES